MYRRFCPIVTQAYLHYDTLTISNPASTSSFTADSSAFVQEQLAAYTPSVLLMLQQLMQFHPSEQFVPNRHWVIPLLTQLIVCNDRNIRKLITMIYEKLVNPFILRSS